MYKNRALVRDLKVRVYLNENEQKEINQAADDAGSERASFMREASLVVARYIQSRKRTETNSSALSLRHLEARLARISDDFRYLLVG